MKKTLIYIISAILLLIITIFIYNTFVLKSDSNEHINSYRYETIYGKKGTAYICDIDRTVGESYCIHPNTGERMVVASYRIIEDIK